MDQNMKDFIFLQHFNPKRDADLGLSCPFCGSHALTRDGSEKFVCHRCGRVLSSSIVMRKAIKKEDKLWNG